MTEQEIQKRLNRYRLIGRITRVLLWLFVGHGLWSLYWILTDLKVVQTDSWWSFRRVLMACAIIALLYIFIDSRNLPDEQRREARSFKFRGGFRK